MCSHLFINSGKVKACFPYCALNSYDGGGGLRAKILGQGGRQASRAKIVAESAQRSQYIFAFTRFGG